MIPGIQTHFNAWIPQEELEFCAANRFVLARIDAMECDHTTFLSMVEAVERVGMRPFITVKSAALMRLRPGLDYECRNEDDGDISPLRYRRILDEMAQVALETGSRLWGPTCSNTNARCVRWASQVRGRGWPTGLHGISWHSYDPHENRLFKEVETLAGDRPIIWSEFGYPSNDHVTEEQQGARIAELWKFYEKYYGAILFQIHDGAGGQGREDHYGIRAYDGHWKPAAFTVPHQPQPQQEDELPIAEPMLSKRDLIPARGIAGIYTCRYPKGADTVLSIQPDGEWQTRPAGTEGAWEVLRIEGNRAVFFETEHTNRGIPLGE